MTYIALLVALAFAGGYAALQYVVPQTDSAETQATSIMDPITAAKEAVQASEAASGVTPGNAASSATAPRLETMQVAGGCFWCVEADLEKLPGVTAAVSGYAGGSNPNPSYQTYAKDGHREVVLVTYDANTVTFEQILIYALKHMDPTDDNGSFGDRGEYYSPAFYFATPAEKEIIDMVIADIDANGPYQKPLAIDVQAETTFYPAEDFHQDYYKGTLSQLKYQYYRTASGRDKFIAANWGTDTGATLPWRTVAEPEALVVEAPITTLNTTQPMWETYVKPDEATLKATLDATTFSVTQKEGTERAGTSPLDKNYEAGIYVDVLSGEPLFSSKDKFNSGTGWPSFVKPIASGVVTEHVDNTFFSTRTEVRSAIADNHLGHVFPDGPADRGGLRYCLNGVALRFIPQAEMEAAGYAAYLGSV